MGLPRPVCEVTSAAPATSGMAAAMQPDSAAASALATKAPSVRDESGSARVMSPQRVHAERRQFRIIRDEGHALD